MGHQLFLFNPDSEIAIANESRYYVPSANVLLMARELAYLPAYYAGPDDYILLDELPDELFRNSRETIFGIKNRTVTWEDLKTLEFDEAQPWGWSPRAYHLLGKVKDCGTWNPGQKELYSRKTALECLKQMTGTEEEWMPRVCRSLNEISALAAKRPCVVKAPWSSSGRGLLFLQGTVTAKEEEWLRGVLRKQGYVMVEKRLDKVYDFAMEFYADGKTRVDFIGLSAFYTGEGGEYKGNYLGKQQTLEEMLAIYLGPGEYEKVKARILKVLPGLLFPDYKGYFGVDMMVYRNDAGEYRLQPCVEINLRYNMGILALCLSRRYLAEEAEGIFQINYFPAAGDAWRENLRKQEAFPLIMQENKIVSGYINLTPVTMDTKFIAEVIIKNKTF